MVKQTIDIPRILVVPKGEVTTGFQPFSLDCSAIHYQPVERDILWHIYMLEPKAKNEMTDADVLAKKEAAVKWCELASNHNQANGGKPWKYALIPHDAIAENMTLAGLVAQFGTFQ